MGITAVVGVISAAAAVSQAVTAKKQARQQSAAADAARLDAQFQAQANNQAGVAAVERQKAAEVAAAAQATAAEQLSTTPDVTISDGTNADARRRRVQASFDVGTGGAGGDAGSIRV